MSRVVRVFMDVDMRMSHDGLTGLCLENKIDLRIIEDKEFIVFINHRKDKIKMITSQGVLAYYRNPPGRPIDLRIIQMIPKAFGASGKLNYDANLKDFLLSKLPPIDGETEK